MVLKSIKVSKLVLNVVETEDTVFEVISTTCILGLITAACQNGIQEVDGDSSDHEDWMLQQIEQDVVVKAGKRFINCACVESIIVLPLLVLDEIYGGSSKNDLQYPLDKGLWSEALISADFIKEAMALAKVDTIVTAESKSIALHLAPKSQINQEIVEEEVVDDQQGHDCRQDDSHDVDFFLPIQIQWVLSQHLLDEAIRGHEDQDCERSQEDQLGVLDQVHQAQRTRLHLISNILLIIISSHLSPFKHIDLLDYTS